MAYDSAAPCGQACASLRMTCAASYEKRGRNGSPFCFQLPADLSRQTVYAVLHNQAAEHRIPCLYGEGCSDNIIRQLCLILVRQRTAVAMSLSANGFVAGVFIVVGGFFLMIGVIELTRGLASRSWDAVCGEIIESRVTQGLAPGYGWFWHVEVRYRYTVEGRTYEGDRFRFGTDPTFWTQNAAERAVSLYPKGRIVQL